MYKLVKLIKEVCNDHCEKVAVRFYSDGRVTSISYQQFNEAADVVAEVLNEAKKNLEIAARSYIAILADVSDIYPVIIQGILLSGNPFVCLDVDGSENGLINLIKKLKIEILLTNEKYAKKIGTKFEKSEKLKDFKLFEHACEIWKTGVSNETSKTEDAASNNKRERLSYDKRERLLYAIQTSGSTGEKKIVQVTEDCILPNILELREVFNVCPTDVIYYGSPVTFDPHIVELFLALTSGASLFIAASKARAAAIPTLVDVLFPEENSENPGNDCATPTLLDVHFPEETPGNDGAIPTLVDVRFSAENSDRDWCVTLIQTTPSVFLSWPKQLTRDRVMRRLKVLALGGEECPSYDKLSDYCSPADFSKIYNLHGITEVSCWASYRQLCAGKDWQTLGEAMRETTLQVRDTDGSVVSDGIGEMFIGSQSRICILDDETISQVLEDSKKEPVFRATGDLVQVENCGKSLKFVGRRDRVVKRWGQKVNLGLIEEAAMKNAYVSNCCCINDVTRGLVLFYQADNFQIDHNSQLKFWLKKDGLLPNNASVPDTLIQLHELPLNCNGKIDRSQLEKILRETDPSERNSTLKIPFKLHLRSLWISCTSGSSVDFEENNENSDKIEGKSSAGFISCGGTSISAVQFISKLLQFLPKVPSELLTNLLSDCTFEECCSLLDGTKFGKNVETKFLGNDQPKFGKKFEKNVETNSVESIGTKQLENVPYYFVKNVGTKRGENIEAKVSENVPSKFGNNIETNLVENIETNSVEGIETTSNLNCEGFSDISEPIIKRKKIEIVQNNADCAVSSVKCRGKLVVFSKSGHECLELNLSEKIKMTIEWKYFLKKCVDASPTVIAYQNGTTVVSVGSHSGDLVQLDFNSGLLKSSCHLPDRIESSLTVSHCGKYGYIGCYDGYLRCIDLETGQPVLSFASSGMVKSTPILDEKGSIIFGSYDQHLYFISDEFQVIWKWKGGGSFYATPCIDKDSNLVFAGLLDGTCVCLEIDKGALKWKTKLSSPIFASPVLLGSDVIVFAEVSGSVNCLKTVCGSLLWTYKADGNIFSSLTSASVANKTLILFGCHDAHVYCLSVCDVMCRPCLIWKASLLAPAFATPFVDILNNLVVAANTTGTVFVMSLSDGSVLTSLKLPGEIFSSPVIHDGRIVVGCRDNYLYCISIIDNANCVEERL